MKLRTQIPDRDERPMKLRTQIPDRDEQPMKLRTNFKIGMRRQ